MSTKIEEHDDGMPNPQKMALNETSPDEANRPRQSSPRSFPRNSGRVVHDYQQGCPSALTTNPRYPFPIRRPPALYFLCKKNAPTPSPTLPPLPLSLPLLFLDYG